ncbi:uncharacterized protein BXIN_0750 [Babesia sp. Xinjiang]|uniref:uncharacterized protein n=1 Tax=Babesia sp. Xinjiang TaxID=462227 RepID=UPI000A23E307|nr:uncharacterized protein BXIN_0750 [Babesia sp. Xinjiang]ORM41369.1 hypothetical protein BXIN_0750 [Babesia sp. Xinjiang]
MGFKDAHFTVTRYGYQLLAFLEGYVVDNISCTSIYNIILCLICVSLRTPRTVGDLLGYFMNIGDEQSYAGVTKPIKEDIIKYPGDSTGDYLISSITALSGKHHDGGNVNYKDGDKANLRSLIDSECDITKHNDRTCGSYLAYFSFGIYCSVSTDFVSTYVSRMVYLAEHLRDGLQILLDEFNVLNCEDCIDCRNKDTQTPCHAKTKPCQCPTIVQCAVGLPLLYKYEFTYNDHSSLRGIWEGKEILATHVFSIFHSTQQSHQ